MRQLLFSVYDSKAKVYSNPFVAGQKGSALRSFQDVSKDKTHPIGKHPEDYALYQIGEWDDDKGIVTATQFECLGKAVEYLE